MMKMGLNHFEGLRTFGTEGFVDILNYEMDAYLDKLILF